MDAFVTHTDHEEKMEQLEKSIYYSVSRIVQYKAKDRASSGYINALSTLILQFTSKIVARDLVAFQQHAKRATISEEDVILLARKMPKAYEHLIEYKEKELGLTKKSKRTKKSVV